MIEDTAQDFFKTQKSERHHRSEVARKKRKVKKFFKELHLRKIEKEFEKKA